MPGLGIIPTQVLFSHRTVQLAVRFNDHSQPSARKELMAGNYNNILQIRCMILIKCYNLVVGNKVSDKIDLYGHGKPVFRLFHPPPRLDSLIKTSRHQDIQQHICYPTRCAFPHPKKEVFQWEYVFRNPVALVLPWKYEIIQTDADRIGLQMSSSVNVVRFESYTRPYPYAVQMRQQGLDRSERSI